MLGYSIGRVSLVAAVVSILAIALAEAFSVTIRDDIQVSLANIVLVVLFIVAGPAAAVVGTLGVVPVVIFRATDRWGLRTVFNTGQGAVSAAAGGYLYAALTDLAQVEFPSAAAIGIVGLATLTYSLVNYFLVAGVVSVSSPDPFLATFGSMVPAMVMQVPTALGLAIMAALLYLQSPWLLLALAVPVLVARYALRAFERLDTSYDELVHGFVTAIEHKDLYTRGHSERVSKLSTLVAEELRVPYEQRRLTAYAALLHDVGKVGVPLCIINKPGPLTDEEFAEIKKHPTIGEEILQDIDFLAPAIAIVRFHHERLDGKGYPYGVDGEQLSQIVRIVTAVDAFDAMTSTRSYRRALSVEAALAELRRCAGRQFDPTVVEALASAVERVGWQPTTDFASEMHLHGRQIPIGTAQERLDPGGGNTAEIPS